MGDLYCHFNICKVTHFNFASTEHHRVFIVRAEASTEREDLQEGKVFKFNKVVEGQSISSSTTLSNPTSFTIIDDYEFLALIGALGLDGRHA